MPEIAIAQLIPPDKYPTWREVVGSFAGERRAEFDAACRRRGLVRERVWVQQTPQGPMEILVIEAADIGSVFERMATSQHPFDVEFRAFLLDVYGLDLTEPLPGPLPEQVLDWSGTPTTAPA